MLVKCIANLGRDLPLDALLTDSGYSIETDFRITVNEYYLVYAMKLISGYMWYAICEENYTSYPIWKPSSLFFIESGYLSKYWIYSFERGKDRDETITKIAYPEWANNHYYYDALTDGDKEEVEIFKKYKALMDLEFSNPGITDKATALDEDWLLCPFCIDAWQTTSKDGMVICPKCQRMLHNPYYEPRQISFI